jgi:hypothetical protein
MVFEMYMISVYYGKYIVKEKTGIFKHFFLEVAEFYF